MSERDVPVPAPLAPPSTIKLSEVIRNFQDARAAYAAKAQEPLSEGAYDLSALEQPKEEKPERLQDEW